MASLRAVGPILGVRALRAGLKGPLALSSLGAAKEIAKSQLGYLRHALFRPGKKRERP